MARQGGRRSKGPREQFTLRVPADHAAKYLKEAEAAGFATINDYLAYKLAEAHNLQFGATEPDSQLGLPLTTRARRETSAA